MTIVFVLMKHYFCKTHKPECHRSERQNFSKNIKAKHILVEYTVSMPLKHVVTYYAP